MNWSVSLLRRACFLFFITSEGLLEWTRRCQSAALASEKHLKLSESSASRWDACLSAKTEAKRPLWGAVSKVREYAEVIVLTGRKTPSPSVSSTSSAAPPTAARWCVKPQSSLGRLCSYRGSSPAVNVCHLSFTHWRRCSLPPTTNMFLLQKKDQSSPLGEFLFYGTTADHEKGNMVKTLVLSSLRRLFPNHVIKMTTVIFREKNWIRWWSRGIVTAWLKRLEPKTYCLIKALVWETIDLQPSSRAGTTEDRKWHVKAWSWFSSFS